MPQRLLFLINTLEGTLIGHGKFENLKSKVGSKENNLRY